MTTLPIVLPSLQQLQANLKGLLAPSYVYQGAIDYDTRHFARLITLDSNLYNYSDIVSYIGDITYAPIQEELFRFLFPLVLKEWEKHVISIGVDNSLHEDLFIFFSKKFAAIDFLSKEEQVFIEDYMMRVILVRLGSESVLLHSTVCSINYSWFECFIAYGTVFQTIDILWDYWWSLHNEGFKLCAIKFISCLIYSAESNPIYPKWTPSAGGGSPQLWPDNYESKWQNKNIDFIEAKLSFEYLITILQSLRDDKLLGSFVKVMIENAIASRTQVELKIRLYISLLRNYSDELEAQFYSTGVV